MSNLSTAIAAENEILKAVDFTYGYDRAMHNIAVAMQSLISQNGNYVIGGKVSAYSSGGMNVSIAPIMAFCASAGSAIVETQTTEPVSFEAASSENDRIDIIEVRAKEVEYEEQKRMFRDPSTSVKTSRTIATKKKIALDVAVKRGSDGSESAPVADAGFVKIAEVSIPAGTLNITDDMIKNIDAHKYNAENTQWTANKTATFQAWNIAEIIEKMLASLNEDGTLKTGAIKAGNIDFGVEGSQVKGSNIPAGQSMSVHGVDFTSSESVTALIATFAEHIDNLYRYSNEFFNRYEYLNVVPAAASTANVDVEEGGEIEIDGIACSIGQMVFLKNQDNAVENGFWEVQSGAWNRYIGYRDTNPKAFKNKLVFVNSGTVNKGKVFFLSDDSVSIGESELNFKEANFTAEALARKFIIRDEKGRAKVEAPEEAKDIANKGYVDTLVQESTYTGVTAFEDESMARNLLDVLGIRAVHSDEPATVEEVKAAIAILQERFATKRFQGLRYCDYLDLSELTVDGVTYQWNAQHKNLRFMIMGFDPFLHSGDVGANGLETHHILFQARNCILEKKMNETDTNEGGYPASVIYTWLNDKFKTGLEDIFGDNLLTIRRLYSNNDNWNWYNDTVFLPHEMEVWGFPNWAKASWDGGIQTIWKPYRDSTIYKIKYLNGDRKGWWLCTPSKYNGGTSCWCFCNLTDHSTHHDAAGWLGGVSPAFCVKI